MSRLVQSGLLLAVLTAVQANCPNSSWKLWNGYCYRLTHTAMSYHGVRANCKSPFRQGDIAMIISKAENDFIKRNIVGQRRVWLGLRSNNGKHYWSWRNKLAVTYTNFDKRTKPNNGTNDVVVMDGRTGFWAEVSSYTDTKLYGVCKMRECWCPSGFTEWDNRCYKAVKRALSWVEARQECQRMAPRADHAVVRSIRGNNYVYNMVARAVPVWLGLNDRAQEGNFSWSSLEGLYFSNWQQNQPNGNNHREDCVVMGNDKKWKAGRCDVMVQAKSFMCEQLMCGRHRWVKAEDTRQGRLAIWRNENGRRCPVGWSRAGTRCFGGITAPASFRDAQKLCAAQHPKGHLALLYVLRDNDLAFLVSHTLPVWLFRSKRIAFGNWRQGDSNRAGCVSLQADGHWLSEPCEKSQPGLCQVPVCIPTCPSGWRLFEGYCYRVDDTRRTMVDAEAACKAAGGHLTSILTEDENDFVLTLAYPRARLSEIKGDQTMWNVLIGATRADKASPWSWLDCQTWTISRFEGRDGSSPAPDDNTCAMITTSGRWKTTLSCDRTSRSVCKMDPCRQHFGPLHRPICPNDQVTTAAPPPATSAKIEAKTAIKSQLINCPNDGKQWQEQDGMCLTVKKTSPMKYREAFKTCRASSKGRFQVRLPVIRYAHRNSALMKLANGADVWLDLFRRRTGFWYWNGRIRVSALHWQAPPTSTTHCASLDGRTGGVVARKCSDQLPFLCQAWPMY